MDKSVYYYFLALFFMSGLITLPELRNEGRHWRVDRKRDRAVANGATSADRNEWRPVAPDGDSLRSSAILTTHSEPRQRLDCPVFPSLREENPCEEEWPDVSAVASHHPKSLTRSLTATGRHRGTRFPAALPLTPLTRISNPNKGGSHGDEDHPRREVILSSRSA